MRAWRRRHLAPSARRVTWAPRRTLRPGLPRALSGAIEPERTHLGRVELPGRTWSIRNESVRPRITWQPNTSLRAQLSYKHSTRRNSEEYGGERDAATLPPGMTHDQALANVVRAAIPPSGLRESTPRDVEEAVRRARLLPVPSEYRDRIAVSAGTARLVERTVVVDTARIDSLLATPL